MAIDLDAIRKKLNQLSGNSSKRNSLWRPEVDTEANVRFLSFKDNNGQPFKELWFYYNIGSNPGLLAPNQFGKPDPVQELITKLRDDGAAGDKSAYELAKKLYPKMRCFAPVVVRGQESEGVKLWAFGKQTYEELLNIMLDDDYGDITDPVTGRDIKVRTYKKPNTQWAISDITPRPKVSPLSEEKTQAKEWMNSIPDPNDLYELKSYEQLEKIVNDWLNGDEERESDGINRNFSNSSSNDDSPTNTLNNKIKDLDSAFASLDL
jgi:hypothetical protein